MNVEFVQLLRAVLKQRATAESSPHYQERTRELHTAFYMLKERFGDDFPALGKLHFITSGAFPYSPDLTEALDLLQMSGAIFRQNPHFDRFGALYYPDTSALKDDYKAAVVGGDAHRSTRFDELVEELATAVGV